MKDRLNFSLSLFLAAALGLGVVGQIIFYLQILGNNFNHFLPPLISLVLLGCLFWKNKTSLPISKLILKNWSLLVLLVLALVFWIEAHFYPMGGWDAWSCWNLKAKFIYLGQERWKDMFAPILWRSNTGYPLALPTINVWFWQWTGLSESIPMLTAIVLTFLTAGVLLLGLQELKVSRLYSALITLSVFSLALNITLSISQYSDILFSLYLLCAFVCYLLSIELSDERLLMPTAIFIGLMCFTKNEGLAAGCILTSLILLRRPKKPWTFISTVFLSALPMVIFVLALMPKSQAFINGLTSAQKPSDAARMGYIFFNTLFEFLRPKWNGLWILCLIGLAVSVKKTFKGELAVIALFLVCYMTIVLAYYQINTFFEISWWMGCTIDRTIYILMPTAFLWMGLSLFKKDA